MKCFESGEQLGFLVSNFDCNVPMLKRKKKIQPIQLIVHLTKYILNTVIQIQINFYLLFLIIVYVMNLPTSYMHIIYMLNIFCPKQVY